MGEYLGRGGGSSSRALSSTGGFDFKNVPCWSYTQRAFLIFQMVSYVEPRLHPSQILKVRILAIVTAGSSGELVLELVPENLVPN